MDDGILIGSLTGALLGLAALWAWYLLGALWRDTLWRLAGASYADSVAELGLTLTRPPHAITGALWAGWKPSIDAHGDIDGWSVALRLAGGVRGERYTLQAKGPGKLKRVIALSEVSDLAQWVRAALASPEETPAEERSEE